MSQNSNHYNKISFIRHYTDPDNPKVVTSKVLYDFRMGYNGSHRIHTTVIDNELIVHLCNVSIVSSDWYHIKFFEKTYINDGKVVYLK